MIKSTTEQKAQEIQRLEILLADTVGPNQRLKVVRKLQKLRNSL